VLLKAKIIVLILFAAFLTQARVLNLADEKFASYFSVEGGTSLLATTPFDQNLAAVDSFSGEYKTSLGGEFGFVYSSPYIAWRFSFEIIKPSKLKEIQALAGTDVQYQVDSDVTAVAPKIGVEIHLNRKPNNRFYAFGYYGSSNLTMTNVYSQVVAPNADHTAELKGAGAVMGGGLGYEMSFVDTTAIVFEIGYRSLNFTEVKFSKDVTTFQGAKVAGDLLTNLDGTNKSLSFTGYTAAIGFRFWL
jgi:hypothetical protein